MQIEQTALPGVVILTPARFGDDRGFFSETWSRKRLAEAGIDLDFVQDNHSLSARAGTLRGLHFQSPPHAQAKLVRCGRGVLWDVAVDIRAGSPTSSGGGTSPAAALRSRARMGLPSWGGRPVRIS